MKTSELEFPWIREELIRCLRALADREHQRTIWVEKKYERPVQFDSFDDCVHFLFDDTTLSESIDRYLGVALYNAEEAHAVTAVIRALDHVFDVHGLTLPDETYTQAREWEAVVRESDDALKLLSRRRDD